MKEKLIQVGGRKVAYLSSAHANSPAESGQQAKPVFFLHGWGGSKESWLQLIEEIGKLSLSTAEAKSDGLSGKQLIAVDLPGFGASEEPTAGWQVEDYAQWFEHFVAALQKEEGWTEDFDLIVHSFGGRITLKMFQKSFVHTLKARPARLVLIAAAGVKRPRTLRVRVAALAARVGKLVMGLPVLNKLAPLAQKILYKALRTHDYEKTSGVMRDTFLKVIEEDLRDGLEQIKIPTLIVWGKRDTYVPVKDAYLMNKIIPGSLLHIIKDGRHGIHRTHAKMLAKWIKEFLNQ